jgi:hypothetical protein
MQDVCVRARLSSRCARCCGERVHAAKPAPAPTPPSAIIAGNVDVHRAVSLSLSCSCRTGSLFQRSFTVPAGGAWLWGDAKYANYLEMDCNHHYQGDADPALGEYTPLFTAGELPAAL